MKCSMLFQPLMLIWSFSSIFAETTPLTSDSLEVWIELPGDHFQQCERIPIYLFVVNHGPISRILPYVGGYIEPALKLSILQPDNTVFRMRGISCHWSNEQERLAVDPGDTMVYFIGFYAAPEKSNLATCYPVGRYSISGLYLDKYKLGPVEFTMDPISDEEMHRVITQSRMVGDEVYYPVGRENHFRMLIPVYEMLDPGPAKSRVARDLFTQMQCMDKLSKLHLDYIARFLCEDHDVFLHVRCMSQTWLHFGPDRVVEVIRSCPQLLSDRYFRHVLRHYLLYMRRTDLYARIISPPVN